MQKSILKTALQNSEGKTMEFTFRAPVETLTGSYKILSVKTGRGKGGSLVVTAKNLTTDTDLSTVLVEDKTMNFGTSMSEWIVNCSADGVLHGPNSAEEDKDNLQKKPEFATKLRESMMPLLGKEGIKIKIDSKLPRINGVWKITSSLRSPGVFGQLKFNLVSEDGLTTTELWTYRHSGCIIDISLVEE